MRRFIFVYLLFFTVFAYTNSISEVYRDLDNLSIESGRTATVAGYEIFRDIATFRLLKGQLHMLTPVNGRRVAALFHGDFEVKLSPQSEIDKERFVSEFGAEEYLKEHNTLVLFFTDGTLEELLEAFDFNEQSEKSYSYEIKNALDYLYFEETESYKRDLIRALINPEERGYFYAHAHSKRHIKQPIFFEINPYNKEEISVLNRFDKVGAFEVYNLITRFNSLEGKMYEPEIVRDEKFAITASMDKQLDFEGICNIEFLSNQNGGRWIYMFLYDELEVDYVKDENGEVLEHYLKEDNSVLWIELKKQLQKDKTYSFEINYHGDLVARGGTNLFLGSYDYWYPQFKTTSLKTFDICFTYPSRYKFVTVGSRKSSSKSGKFRTDHWVTNYPVNYAPVNIGKFKEKEYSSEDLPYLSFHVTENLKTAHADVTNCVNFYQQVFGKCCYDTILVADIPRILSGEAYPGLINFYNDEYLKHPVSVTMNYGNGRSESFFYDYDISSTDFVQLRAHEAAHQWWGCGVQCDDFDHDRWLFEGLAEFSSLWFVQMSLEDNKKYFDMLEKWKIEILSAHLIKSKSDKTDVPPILSYNAPQYIVYGKGAWILHMLRNLMVDLKTYDETKFSLMLKDFYSTYKGKRAGTSEFQEIVEKHMGMDMGWFFDQWVYGNQIPDLKFDYEIKENSAGEIYALCKVTQENVDEEFRSYIPIEFDFGSNRTARIRKKAEGNYTEFEIKLPAKPVNVEFNIHNSILDSKL